MGTQTLPKPDITFVIPTKNNEITIDACIKSLQNQKNVNVEIIVVDNHSTDNTAKIAKNNNVTVIVGGPERCSQRNIGTLNANSNIVAFIDSDMVAKPQIGTEAVKLLNTHTNWAGLIIPEYSFGEGFWTKCKALEKSLYVGDTTVEAGRIWRKNELMQAGGWNENLIAGEDWELTERMLNYKKQTHPNATMGRTNEYIGHNEGRLSLKGTYQKKRYYGQFLGKYMKEGGSKHLKRTSLLNSKLLKHPIEGTGVVILKTVEAVGIGVGALTAKKENPATVAPSKNAEITVAHTKGAGKKERNIT